eukprot:15202-Pyramimonas_sp.AAC.1
MLGRLGMRDPETAPPVDFKRNSAFVEDSVYVYVQRAYQEQDLDDQQRLAEAFRKSVSRYDKVFFPIQRPEGIQGHESGHWALLAIENLENGISL